MSRRPRTVAVFGGSFDPPHVGHQMAALWALESGEADEVLWVPCFRHPYDKPLTPFSDRLAMCRAAARPCNLGTVTDLERRLGGVSRTLRTLRALRARRPSARLRLLVGADVVRESRRWHGYREILGLCDFLVVGRGGFRDPAAARVRLPAVASSRVRRDLRAGRDVAALVPRAVLAIIRRRGLYAR